MKGTTDKSGPKTRARVADEKEAVKTAKRQKTLFAPRKTVGPRDILVDTAAGKIKVDPAIEVKVHVNPEEPGAPSANGEAEASVSPEVIVKEEVDVTLERTEQPSPLEDKVRLLKDKVERLESSILALAEEKQGIRGEVTGLRHQIDLLLETNAQGDVTSASKMAALEKKNEELMLENRMQGQRIQQMFQEMQKFVQGHRDRAEKTEYIPKRVHGTKTPRKSTDGGYGGPTSLIYPNLSEAAYHFYRALDFQLFENTWAFRDCSEVVRHIRIFPCAQEPDQLSNFWESTFKFLEKHGRNVEDLQLAQVVNQPGNEFVDTAGNLLQLVPNLDKLTIEGSFTESDLPPNWMERLTELLEKLEMMNLMEVKFVWTSTEKDYDLAAKLLGDFFKEKGKAVWSRFKDLEDVELTCELDEAKDNWSWSRVDEAESEAGSESDNDESKNEDSAS